MTTTEIQKEAILKVYSGEDWKKRLQKMKPNQVTAIYLRLQGQGKIK